MAHKKRRLMDYVGLNVGGKIFKTSQTTLLRYEDSFFSHLLNSEVPSTKDDQGNYLIDQDGEVFRHVLNFLRYGELVLPEGFSEYSLLKHQADFFQLQTLFVSIRKPVPMGGAGPVGLMFRDGRVFHTTREILMREENSYFTKILIEEIAVPRDRKGIYVLDRGDSGVFHHILSYLEKGGITEPITSDELERLKKDASSFGLKVFENHLDCILFLPQHGHSLLLFFYYSSNSPCVAYGKIDTPLPSPSLLHAYEGIFQNMIPIYRQVMSGFVNMNNIKSEEPASLHEVISYFKTKTGTDCTPKVLNINSNLMRIMFKYF